jgi:hypothetical protein
VGKRIKIKCEAEVGSWARRRWRGAQSRGVRGEGWDETRRQEGGRRRGTKERRRQESLV